MISLTITGKPISQQRHRATKTGRIYDPSAKDKKKTWLRIAAYKPKKAYDSNISVHIDFHFPRPKHHFRTGKFRYQLKNDVPIQHIIRPDIDNLVKFYLDIMQGKDRFYIDDSQICVLNAIKIYCYQDEEPHTEIQIVEIP